MDLSSIQIDEKKCTECLLCVKECVSGVILDPGDKPEVINPAWCNRCSHCVAVCPAKAVTHRGLKGDSPRPIKKDKIDPAHYRETVMTRRSVRWYRNKAISRKEIEDILNLANYSPTASNAQDVGYVVITNKDLIQKTAREVFGIGGKIKKISDAPLSQSLIRLFKNFNGLKNINRYTGLFELYQEWVESGRDLILHNAPVLIIVHGPSRERFARDNCIIASTNITNYAHAKGLGTCYIGLLLVYMNINKKLQVRLGVPKGRKAYVALTLGRPAHKYTNTPIRPPAEIKWMNGV